VTALQLQLALGALIGLGVALVLRALAPAAPDLGAALKALEAPIAGPAPADLDLTTRIGLWADTHAPALVRLRVPAADFAITGVNPVAHTGRKLLAGLYGLALPMIANTILALAGIPLPWAVPALAGPVAGLVFFTIPDGALRDRAADTRRDFTRALVSYIDLVTLERRSGTGTAAALESAAHTADNPTFTRIRATLDTARWAGTPPWDALAATADDIAVPELTELANIMRLAGEETTSIADTLAARSLALRTAIAEDEHAAANAAGERMWIAGALLALIYLTMLAGPGVIRVITG
jgi:hypothetical protein